MMFLSGVWNHTIAPLFDAGTLGLMCRPGNGYWPADAKIWAADSGCFGVGYPGADAYLAWLSERTPWLPSCLFATAPDVVGDAAATLERSLPFLPKIRALGYKAALVGQDGLEDLAVPWDDFDVLFIGGTDNWKLSPAAACLVREAKERGKGTHVGRVNYGKRIRLVRGWETIGAIVDSIDGTRLRWGSDKHLAPLLEALGESTTQGVLI